MIEFINSFEKLYKETKKKKNASIVVLTVIIGIIYLFFYFKAMMTVDDIEDAIVIVVMLTIFMFILSILGQSFLEQYYYKKLYPNIILNYPIQKEDIESIIKDEKNLSNLNIIECFCIRGVYSPVKKILILDKPYNDLYLFFTDNEIVMYFWDLPHKKYRKANIYGYKDIEYIDLTNHMVDEYKDNFKLFKLTMKNEKPKQILACDFDGRLKEEYNKIKNLINKKTGGEL